MIYEKLPLFNHPTAPHNGTDTSIKAAKEIAPHVNRMCDVILKTLYKFPKGLTCQEIEDIAELRHQSCSPRLKELRDCVPALVEHRINESTKQWIRRENDDGTGTCKRTARVNFISQAGREYLEALNM